MSTTKESKTPAKSTITDRLLVQFTATDGKVHNVKWLCDQAITLGKKEGTFAENLFIVAKTMSQAEFDAFDKDVRAAMKWGKAPTKASPETKALYGQTPKAWRNVVSIINQSYKHKMDIKHYDDVYGTEGLNAELKARKDAVGSNAKSVSTGTKVMEELYPEVQGFIIHVTALDAAIKEQPDAKAMLALVMEELTDALERAEAALQVGIQTTGSIDIDAELKKEFSKDKAGTGVAKQAQF